MLGMTAFLILAALAAFMLGVGMTGAAASGMFSTEKAKERLTKMGLGLIILATIAAATAVTKYRYDVCMEMTGGEFYYCLMSNKN